MPKVRKALQYVQRDMNLDRPLLSQSFLTDGSSLFVERYGHLINDSEAGQTAMRELLQGSLQRIERGEDGLAQRLFPWFHEPGEPRTVEIDARRAFGRVVVAGTGIPAETLAARFRANESIAAIARDYRLKPGQVEAAIRWELNASAA